MLFTVLNKRINFLFLDLHCGVGANDCDLTLTGNIGCDEDNNACLCPPDTGATAVEYNGVYYCDEARLGDECTADQNADCLGEKWLRDSKCNVD